MATRNTTCSVLVVGAGDGRTEFWRQASAKYPSLDVVPAPADVAPSHPDVARADIIVLCRVNWTAGHLEAAARCRAVLHVGPGAGCDLEKARELGVFVCRIGDAASEAVGLSVRSILQDYLVEGQPAQAFPSHRQFRRPRLGLIGLGRLGRAIARVARERKFELFAYDPFALEEEFAQAAARRLPRLADALGIPDLVCVQVAPADSNRGMIDVDAIDLMRKGAWLINAGWGLAVDPDAARGAFDAGRLGRLIPDEVRTGVAEASEASGAPRKAAVSLSEQLEASEPAIVERGLQKSLQHAARIARGEDPTPLLIDPPCPRWEP